MLSELKSTNRTLVSSFVRGKNIAYHLEVTLHSSRHYGLQCDRRRAQCHPDDQSTHAWQGSWKHNRQER
ncbi:hypothetical protein AOLI_G00244650 [Acnodon oligacanthus]